MINLDEFSMGGSNYFKCDPSFFATHDCLISHLIDLFNLFSPDMRTPAVAISC